VKVLVVCSGNICRSPMVAEYLRDRAARSGLSHLVVDSAGTLGIWNAGASAEAVQALREIGLDLSSHRSKGLAETDLRTADLVLAMDREHLALLASAFPDERAPRYLLRAFEAGPDPIPNEEAPDLEDPIGAPIEVYRERLRTVLRCVDHLLLHLKYAGSKTSD
jgi:protein-tyrosine phosphatase